MSIAEGCPNGTHTQGSYRENVFDDTHYYNVASILYHQMQRAKCTVREHYVETGRIFNNWSFPLI